MRADDIPPRTLLTRDFIEAQFFCDKVNNVSGKNEYDTTVKHCTRI